MALVLFALALAPMFETIKHGPGMLALEAEHMAFHAEQGHGHGSQAAHHDSADHDHVMTAILPGPAPEVFPAPARHLPAGAVRADDRVREGPRRPPRVSA